MMAEDKVFMPMRPHGYPEPEQSRQYEVAEPHLNEAEGLASCVTCGGPKEVAEPVGVIKEDGVHWEPEFIESVDSETELFTASPSAQAMFNYGVKMAADIVYERVSPPDDYNVAAQILALQQPSDMVVMTKAELDEMLLGAINTALALRAISDDLGSDEDKRAIVNGIIEGKCNE